MTKVTVAPVTTTVKHLYSEVPVGPANGLDAAGVVSIDNILTIAASQLGRTIGYLLHEQERQLADAIIAAFDLDVPLMR